MTETNRERFERLSLDLDELESEMQNAVRVNKDFAVDLMADQSNVFLAWSLMSSYAEAKEKAAKHELEDVVLPSLREEALRKLKESGNNRPTKQQIDDKAMTTSQYADALQAYLDASELASMFKKQEKVLAQRGELLRSLSSRQKQEIGMED